MKKMQGRMPEKKRGGMMMAEDEMTKPILPWRKDEGEDEMGKMMGSMMGAMMREMMKKEKHDGDV